MQRSDVHATRIALDQKVDRLAARSLARHRCGFDLVGKLGGMKTRVPAHQEPRRRQRLGARQRPLQSVFRLARGEVGALAQLQRHAPAFLAEIHRDRCVAVGTGVGARDAFLAGSAVVLGKHVNVQWHQAAGQRRDGGAGVLEQRNRQFIGQRQQPIGLSVQLHAQGRGCGNRAQTQRLGKEAVLAMVFDGVKIRFAGAQQPHIGGDDLANTQPGTLGNGLIQCLAHPGKLRQRQSNQSKPGMVGEHLGSLLELEAGNRIAVGVEYALSHGTNWVNCEKLIIPYYSIGYDVIGRATCGFRTK